MPPRSRFHSQLRGYADPVMLRSRRRVQATSSASRPRAAARFGIGRTLALAAMLAGCQPADRDQRAAPADTLAAAPSAPSPAPRAGDSAAPGDTSADAVLARWAQAVPQEVRLRRGACPFECCTYRQWTAEGPIPVVARERGRGPALFTMNAGQRFQADSGNVWVTGTQLVMVADTVADRPYWAFQPGDTLVVLDHLGEGHFAVWHEGRVRDVEGFWVFRADAARTLGQHRTEWWVHVTLPDGRTGWFEAADSIRIGGADACG